MRVARDCFGRIARAIHQDLLRCDQQVAGKLVGFDVEAVVCVELQQVDAGEIAGRIVEEHVLRAGIRSIDARRVFRRVPLVDGGVVLHAGIAAVVRCFCDLAEQIFGLLRRERLLLLHAAGKEVLVVDSRVHEFVGHPHRVVCVLEEDRRIGR